MPARDGPPARWHDLTVSEVLTRLGTTADGLTDAEAGQRLARVGPNAFRAIPARPAWRILIDQFRSVVVLLLLAALVVALISRDWLDASAIGAVLILNSAIGFFTELRARRTMESLLGLEVSRARVIRGAQRLDIDARDLVPGDVIELEEGQRVPADARLVQNSELRTSEAALTGESQPVDKDSDLIAPAGAPLADRINLVFKTTTVVGGRGRAIVVATGMATEVGRIGELARGVTERKTPLEVRLEALGRRLVVAALAAAAVVGGLSALHGVTLHHALQTAIALAVAAVPEGLPLVATIAMAVGVRRMARRRVLIRRLSAVEALGSATVICTDKTGTLTAGEMTVTAMWVAGRALEVTGSGYVPRGEIRTDGAVIEASSEPSLARLLRAAALCNRATLAERNGEWAGSGDPTEIALLVVARKAGLDPGVLSREMPERHELPFSSGRRFMATFHDIGERTLALVKGAPGTIVDRCASVLTPEGERALDAPGRTLLLERNRALAAEGLRVLALADAEGEFHRGELPARLTFLGFVGLVDPPAPGVPETITAFRKAGIRTVMLTGDQRLTGETIARGLGVLTPGDQVLEGVELDALSDAALSERVMRTAVVSRASPEGKLRVIAALQGRGESVAMLGDGVNDAAALRQADIGVAMGQRGTDVAKEAADVILADDRFQTTEAAIEEGRVIFDNIRKFVFYLFSCNLAEILVLLFAGLAGLSAPLLPLQILWLNLLTDTAPALALALEPADPDVMRRPPRPPGESLLTPPMVVSTVAYALGIAAVTMAAFWWGANATGRPEGHSVTMSFMTLGFAQIFHLGNARSSAHVLSPNRIFANRYAFGAVAVAVVLQIATLQVPWLAGLLHLTRFSALDWAVVLGLSAIPAVAGQWLKAARAVPAS